MSLVASRRFLFTAGVPARMDTVLVSALVLVGMYFPTSVGGDFSKALLGANYLAAFVLLILLARRYGIAGFGVSVICLSIVPLLLVFTLTSHLNFYTPGALAAYILLSLLLILRIRSAALHDWTLRLFIVVNILNVVAIAGVLAGFEPVGQLLVDRYSAAWPGLVQYMFDVRKPVLTFASHSIAGFFFYLFFYCTLQTWRITGRKLFLFFGCCYVFALFSLLSTTGLLLGALAFCQLNFYLWARSRKLVVATLLVVAVGVPIGLRLTLPVSLGWSDALEIARATMTSQDNGMAGRFGPGGTLFYDVSYMKEHPLSPVGVSYTDQLFFGDSGPIEYLLRGSVPLLLIVFGGYFLFLRRNLLSRADAYLVFFVTLAFEVGYTTLTYYRAFYLIPFVVIYLNGLRRGDLDTAPRLALKSSQQQTSVTQR
jgi:hypothetical protein